MGLSDQFKVLASDNYLLPWGDTLKVDAFNLRFGWVWREELDDLNDGESDCQKNPQETDGADRSPSQYLETQDVVRPMGRTGSPASSGRPGSRWLGTVFHQSIRLQTSVAVDPVPSRVLAWTKRI